MVDCSITELTDSTGNVVQRYVYNSFGQIVSQTGTVPNPYTYTGREYDSESGLYYYRARYYDASIGRFIQEDLLNFVSFQLQKDFVPEVLRNFFLRFWLRFPSLQQNLYIYVGNNAINKIDPMGLAGISIGFEGTGALFGFGGFGGIYGNFAHDPSKSWYSGWSSSVTVTLGGGAAASAYGFSGGVYIGGSNICDVKQLEGFFQNGGRFGLGAFSLSGFRSPNGSVTGGGVTVGPSSGYIGAFAGGSNTSTLSGGEW